MVEGSGVAMYMQKRAQGATSSGSAALPHLEVGGGSVTPSIAAAAVPQGLSWAVTPLGVALRLATSLATSASPQAGIQAPPQPRTAEEHDDNALPLFQRVMGVTGRWLHLTGQLVCGSDADGRLNPEAQCASQGHRIGACEESTLNLLQDTEWLASLSLMLGKVAGS
jgi:hypothetical protein